MKAYDEKFGQNACAVLLSLALTCGCDAALAHAGAAGASGAASASAGVSGGGNVGGGGHGAVGAHGLGRVATPTGRADVASSIDPSVSHHGGVGGGVVYPFWDPDFWSRYGDRKPRVKPTADGAATTAPGVHVPEQTSNWYYCPDSSAYYPYVLRCASAWRQVARVHSS